MRVLALQMSSVRALLIPVLLLSACNDNASGPLPQAAEVPASVALTLSSFEEMTSAGDTRTVSAVVKDANQEVIFTPSIMWSSSAPNVAIVAISSGGATITAIDDGTAVITANSGNVRETVSVTVRRKLVSFEITNSELVIAAGTNVPLNVVGRDARGQSLTNLTGITYRSSNGWEIVVSPAGMMTALYSSNSPHSSNLTATVTRDDVTLSSAKGFTVASTRPSAFEFVSLMLPGGQLPEPIFVAGDAIMYFTLDGPRVTYQIFWSHLTSGPLSAHIHLVTDDARVGAVIIDFPLGNQAEKHGKASGSFSAADIRGLGSDPMVARDSLMKLLSTFAAYVDIHTPHYSQGELGGLVYPHPYSPPMPVRQSSATLRRD